MHIVGDTISITAKMVTATNPMKNPSSDLIVFLTGIETAAYDTVSNTMKYFTSLLITSRWLIIILYINNFFLVKLFKSL